MLRIVYYTAKWCQPCQSFKPVVNRLAEELGFDVEYKDINEDEIGEEVVMSVPTLAFYRDDKRIGTLHGSYPEVMFRQKLWDIFGVR